MRFLILALFLLTSLSSEENHDNLIGWNPRIQRHGEPISRSDCIPNHECCVSDDSTSHLSIGGSYTYAYIKPTGKGSTAGSLGGIQALYEYKTYCCFYGAAEASWKQGNTNRSGSRFLVQFDIEERLGYSWGNCPKDRLFTLFSGFGYRRNAEKVTRDGNKVDFYYNQFYIPTGFLFKGKLSPIVSLGINFHWMPQVFSTVLIRPLKGARWALNNKIGNCRAELPLTLSFCENLFFIVQPFFEYWRDGHTCAKSQAGTSLRVPGNTYLFAGIELNFGYSF